MNLDDVRHGVTKTHPATREMLPDDPLSLNAVEVPGDADLMMRLLVEEYARMGWGLDTLMSLARDPFYQAFHGHYRRLGEEGFRCRISEILACVGVVRVKTVEAEAPPAELVEIQLQAPAPRSDDHA